MFNNYAKAVQEDIDEQHDLIRSLTYDLRDPLVTVYSPIDELMKVAEAADNPFTETQLVKLALAILNQPAILKRQSSIGIHAPQLFTHGPTSNLFSKPVVTHYPKQEAIPCKVQDYNKLIYCLSICKTLWIIWNLPLSVV